MRKETELKYVTSKGRRDVDKEGERELPYCVYNNKIYLMKNGILIKPSKKHEREIREKYQKQEDAPLIKSLYELVSKIQEKIKGEKEDGKRV